MLDDDNGNNDDGIYKKNDETKCKITTKLFSMSSCLQQHHQQNWIFHRFSLSFTSLFFVIIFTATVIYASVLECMQHIIIVTFTINSFTFWFDHFLLLYSLKQQRSLWKVQTADKNSLNTPSFPKLDWSRFLIQYCVRRWPDFSDGTPILHNHQFIVNIFTFFCTNKVRSIQFIENKKCLKIKWI